MKEQIYRALCFVRRIYEADKPYYRRLIVRAIEDGIVLYVLFDAVWSLAHFATAVFERLGVG